jgi:hypothetical protein
MKPPNTEAPDRGAFVEAGVVATAGRDLNPPSSPPEATGRLAALLASLLPADAHPLPWRAERSGCC